MAVSSAVTLLKVPFVDDVNAVRLRRAVTGEEICAGRCRGTPASDLRLMFRARTTAAGGIQVGIVSQQAAHQKARA